MRVGMGFRLLVITNNQRLVVVRLVVSKFVVCRFAHSVGAISDIRSVRFKLQTGLDLVVVLRSLSLGKKNFTKISILDFHS